jgi:hypothetical protein
MNQSRLVKVFLLSKDLNAKNAENSQSVAEVCFVDSLCGTLCKILWNFVV